MPSQTGSKVCAAQLHLFVRDVLFEDVKMAYSVHHVIDETYTIQEIQKYKEEPQPDQPFLLWPGSCGLVATFVNLITLTNQSQYSVCFSDLESQQADTNSHEGAIIQHSD